MCSIELLQGLVGKDRTNMIELPIQEITTHTMLGMRRNDEANPGVYMHTYINSGLAVNTQL